MAEEIRKIPPARSLMTGLRCIGYNFSTALSDIIDNSISAEAKNIYVLSNPDYDEPYIAIVDDGCGMGRKELENAMVLGSDRTEKADSDIELGRFGLGLKSASFSQCKMLTVVSKRTNKINAFRYDLDLIEQKNDWILQSLDNEEINILPEIDLLKDFDTGTIVIWQKFDKIAESSKFFKSSFISCVADSKKHVEYVFHRFYDSVNIEFNGHRIEKRDPFLSQFSETEIGRTNEILIDGEKIEVTPYVLPNSNKLTEEHKKLLGNPNSIYDEQGFYIYRNKRLIIWGSWLHMNIRSEFNKLARVKVDVPSGLDSVWMLDVKKSTVKIPDMIKDRITISLNDSIKRSKRVVKYPGRKEQETYEPVWNRISLPNGKVKYEINKNNNPIYSEFVKTLDYNQTQLFNAFVSKVEEFIPKGLIFSDNADSLEIINSEEDLEEESLVSEVICFAQQAPDPVKCVELLLGSQSYKKIEYRRDEILEMIKDE